MINEWQNKVQCRHTRAGHNQGFATPVQYTCGSIHSRIRPYSSYRLGCTRCVHNPHTWYQEEIFICFNINPKDCSPLSHVGLNVMASKCSISITQIKIQKLTYEGITLLVVFYALVYFEINCFSFMWCLVPYRLSSKSAIL